MATRLNSKEIKDLQTWRPEGVLQAATGAGMCMASDTVNQSWRNPYIYLLRSNTALDQYNPRTGDWNTLSTPALAGTFGAGATAIYHASAGPRGTLAAGSTSTVINITTALPAAVGVNSLANNGKGTGYRIRIIGSGTAGSGKIEERTIVANTSGTTPVITLDSALSFTPTSTDKYEILGGRIFLLGASTLAAGIFKYYDIATNSYSGNLSTTNLPATIGTDSSGIALSELNVPNDTIPGAGFITGASTYNAASPIGCISATAVTNTTNATVTGAGMPSTLATNEYRNFQLRIVEDTTNTTSVGQRIRITSHTSGATGVFTCSGVFTVAPSATAKFVIENDDSKIILRSSATTSVYTYHAYSVSGSTADTWDTSTFGVAGSNNGAGCYMVQSFGITRDTTGNARHSFVYFVRGASTSIDVLDIAGGANGTWTASVTFGGYGGVTPGSGSCGAYDPVTNAGRYAYLNVSGGKRFIRLDLRNRVVDAFSYFRFLQGTAVVGGKMAFQCSIDGGVKVGFVYHASNTQTQLYSIPTIDPITQNVSGLGVKSNFTSTSSATLASFNPTRRKLMVYNEGPGTLYLDYTGGTASATSYSFPMGVGDFVDVPNQTNAITAIFGSGSSTARVTEVF